MLTSDVLKELAQALGPRNVLTAPEDLACYSYDAAPFFQPPEVVILPGSVEEVQAVIRLANRERVPVVPRGAGTNLSGGSVPVCSGIVLSTQRMSRMREIDPGNLTATVEPGVVLGDFRRAVEALGLYYPPDPSSLSVATMGGTVAENAGGPRCFKYGTTRDYVIGLEVVLPTGERMATGGKTVKNVSGYNMTHLFVGSEGTLGVITSITVRLVPLPEEWRTCLAAFDRIDDACHTVTTIVRQRMMPAALELVDDVCLRAIESFRPIGLPQDAEAALLIEVDGSALDVPNQLARVVKICRQCGAREVRIAESREESEVLWAARRSSFAAVARLGRTTIVEDATVPPQMLPRLVRAVKDAAARYQLKVALVAHAGDGNSHPTVMCDGRDPDEARRVGLFLEEVARTCLELGGTLTGEHGIGLVKAPFLPLELGESGMATMRRIKQALDPNNILNPGKLGLDAEPNPRSAGPRSSSPPDGRGTIPAGHR